MTATVIHGNALDLAACGIAGDSVDVIITSPPYFGLRSYQDDGKHYEGQIGAEATPTEFVDALVAATAEMARVLKPTGSIFVNLGDKYNSAASGQNGTGATGMSGGRHDRMSGRGRTTSGVPVKSLVGLPWRYAIRCMDDLGLILRAEIVWSKPNGLPESVTDRVRRSHETWFHFTKSPRYYANVDEVREPYSERMQQRATVYADRDVVTGAYSQGSGRNDGSPSAGIMGFNRDGGNPLGKLPGSVWTVPTQPLRLPPELGVQHFAAFPMEWPRRFIKGWCPNAVCTSCGFLLGSSYDSGLLGVRGRVQRTRQEWEARQVLLEGVREQAHGAEQSVNDVPATDDAWVYRVVEAGTSDGEQGRLRDGAPLHHGGAPRPAPSARRGRSSRERGEDGQQAGEPAIAREGRARQTSQAAAGALPVPALRGANPSAGHAVTCPHCDSSDVREAVTADPFGGTGTTATVAHALGRHGITVDLSRDYCRVAEWRTTDTGQLAKARKAPKPKETVTVPTDQGDVEVLADEPHLLDLLEDGAS